MCTCLGNFHCDSYALRKRPLSILLRGDGFCFVLVASITQQHKREREAVATRIIACHVLHSKLSQGQALQAMLSLYRAAARCNVGPKTLVGFDTLFEEWLSAFCYCCSLLCTAVRCVQRIFFFFFVPVLESKILGYGTDGHTAFYFRIFAHVVLALLLPLFAHRKLAKYLRYLTMAAG